MKRSLIVLSAGAMFFGCGGKKDDSPSYLSVSGKYDTDIYMENDCACTPYSQTFSEEITFAQSVEADDTPLRWVTLYGWGFALPGELDKEGGYLVPPLADVFQGAEASYAGVFLGGSGEASEHIGKLTALYAEGECCNGNAGTATFDFHGVRRDGD